MFLKFISCALYFKNACALLFTFHVKPQETCIFVGFSLIKTLIVTLKLHPVLPTQCKISLTFRISLASQSPSCLKRQVSIIMERARIARNGYRGIIQETN